MEIIRGVYVDSFRLKKPNSIYFLTHWHSDHYQGITTNWAYGPIYCSITTRKILLTKYPKLSQITTGLQLNKPYSIITAQGTQLIATLFNSNHIAGSVIILFKTVDNRYIIHTGDMRFNSHVLSSTPQLFQLIPNTQTQTQTLTQYRCRYQIDTVFLDNTYCDPIFMFPNRVLNILIYVYIQSDALKMIQQIIQEYGPPGIRKIYLVTDSIGKEEAFVGLALHYHVRVGLCRERMNYVTQMFEKEVVEKLFCRKQDMGKKGSWIQVIKRRDVDKVLKQDQRAIAIKLTGWANIQASYPLSERQFIVPYSLHSNYQQLQLFMSVVRPKNLFPVVRLNHNKSNKFRQNIHSYGSYFGSLAHMKQRGFAFFVSNYLSIGYTNANKNKHKYIKDIKNNGNLQKQVIQQYKMDEQLQYNDENADNGFGNMMKQYQSERSSIQMRNSMDKLNLSAELIQQKNSSDSSD